jgi:uncharacterized protein involved in exopolysaccharide biosynthesis
MKMVELFGLRFTSLETSRHTGVGSSSLRVIWSRIWVAALISAAFVASGVQSDMLSPYTFSAEVMRVPGENNADLISAVSRDASTHAPVQTTVQVFGSHRILETVVDALNVTHTSKFNPFAEPPPETMVSRLSEQARMLPAQG